MFFMPVASQSLDTNQDLMLPAKEIVIRLLNPTALFAVLYVLH